MRPHLNVISWPCIRYVTPSDVRYKYRLCLCNLLHGHPHTRNRARRRPLALICIVVNLEMRFDVIQKY